MRVKRKVANTRVLPVRDLEKISRALVLATSFSISVLANAAPKQGEITAGEGSISQQGNETLITQQSQSLSLDWSSFNIQAHERVEYIQPNASSVALNRIHDNNASQIFGRLDANGQVILMNPHGIYFGESATVNVGSLVASGLTVTDEDFLNGEYTFSNFGDGDGFVINHGIINAASGGSVTLVGKSVENDGLISARLGTVNLAAGKEAVLTFDDTGVLGVRVTKEILQDEIGVDAAVINSGDIDADGGRVLLSASVSQDIFSRAVNSEEITQAKSLIANGDGSFSLGGGANVVNSGNINAASTQESTGSVVLLGENIENVGTVSVNADGNAESAGNIEIHSNDTTLVLGESLISANADIVGEGGDIKILGNKVGVTDSAKISAQGNNAGGQVLIGGDVLGENPNIRNAEFVYVGADTEIKADATVSGDGGKVVAFAEDTARIYGSLTARGGNKGGNGGFIETSGLRGFEILNAPDTSALVGNDGTWLIDPYNISIITGDTAQHVNINSGLFESTNTDATLGADLITDAFATNQLVRIRTRDDGGAQDGNISVNASINVNSNNDNILEILAHNDININQDIRGAGSGELNVYLQANLDDAGGGDVNLSDGVTVATNGGGFVVGLVRFFDPNGAPISKDVISGNIARKELDISVNGAISVDFSGATIDTSSSRLAGNISVYSSNNIDVGNIIFDNTVLGNNASGSLAPVLTFNSDSGDVTFHQEIDFHNTRLTNSVGRFRADMVPELVVQAENIKIPVLINDGTKAGPTADMLDITLEAEDTISISGDIFTGGGTFRAEAENFLMQDLNRATVSTNSARPGAPGSQTGDSSDVKTTTDGSVSIFASESIILGDIETYDNCNNNNCGHLNITALPEATELKEFSISQDNNTALVINGKLRFNFAVKEADSEEPPTRYSINLDNGQNNFRDAKLNDNAARVLIRGYHDGEDAGMLEIGDAVIRSDFSNPRFQIELDKANIDERNFARTLTLSGNLNFDDNDVDVTGSTTESNLFVWKDGASSSKAVRFIGGAAADEFILGNNFTGEVVAGSGQDIIRIDDGSAGNINAGVDDDFLIFEDVDGGPGMFGATVDAGTGSDVLIINAPLNDDGGTINAGNGFDRIFIASDVESFINGGGGSDLFIIAEPNVTAKNLYGGSNNSNDDAIISLAAESIWEFDHSNTVVRPGEGQIAQYRYLPSSSGGGEIVFGGIEHVLGSAGKDTFNVLASEDLPDSLKSISGLGGADIFNLAAGGFAADGYLHNIPNGLLNLLLADFPSIVNSTLGIPQTNIDLNQIDAVDEFNIFGNNIPVTINTGNHPAAVADILIRDGDSTGHFYINGSNSGWLSAAGGQNKPGNNATLFNFIEFVAGSNSGADNFNIIGDVSEKTIRIDGGSGGNDTITSPASGGFWYVSPDDQNRLLGEALTDVEEVSEKGVNFVGIETLIGNLSGNDIFTLLNRLSDSDYTIAVQGRSSGNSRDELVGLDQSVRWQIDGSGGSVSYTLVDSSEIDADKNSFSVKFTGIDLVTGGNQDDVFIFSDVNNAITVDGGEQVTQDIADFSNLGASSSGDVELVLGGDLGFSNIEFLVGSEKVSLTSALRSRWLFVEDDADALTLIDGINDGTVTLLADDSVTEIETFSFVDFANVTGSNFADTFIFNGEQNGVVAGAGGDDRFVIGANSKLNQIVGGGGNSIDQILGPDENTTWQIKSNLGGSVLDASSETLLSQFNGIEALLGGAADDKFEFAVLASSMLLDGGDSQTFDVVDFSAFGAAQAEQIDVILGRSQINTSDVEYLLGHEMIRWRADNSSQWVFVADDNNPLTPVDGVDDGTVTILGGGGITYNFIDFDHVVASDQADTIRIEGRTTDSINGGRGNDSIFLTETGVSNELRGGNGNDVIFGADVATNWNIVDDNQGTVKFVGETNNRVEGFFAVERIVAGDADDIFGFTGSIGDVVVDGGGHIEGDIADYSGLSGGAANKTVQLGGNLGITNIELLQGGPGIKLTATQRSDWLFFADDNDASTLVDGVNDGVVELFANNGSSTVTRFIDFADIASGGGADNFIIEGQVSGTIDGEGGGDSFLLGEQGSVKNIIGGNGNDQIVGINRDTEWTINGANDGSIRVVGESTDRVASFSDIDLLQGGDADDVFKFIRLPDDDLTIDGGDQVNIDIADYSGLIGNANDKTINLGSDLDLKNIELLRGGPGIRLATSEKTEWLFYADDGDTNTPVDGVNDGIVEIFGSAGQSTTMLFIDFANVSSGAGEDTFNIEGQVTGTLAGDGGDDIFFIVDTGSVNNIVGGTGNDKIEGPNRNTRWEIAGSGTGTATNFGGGNTRIGRFSGVERLEGGNFDDIFEFNGALADIAIDGGARGLDIADYRGLTGNSTNAIIEFGGNDGISRIEQLIGQFGMTLRSNVRSRWRLTPNDNNNGTLRNGQNDGVLTLLGNGSDGEEIEYINFFSIEGSPDNDIFDMAGSIGTVARGRGGDDQFNILRGDINANIEGGAGQDRITQNLDSGNLWKLTQVDGENSVELTNGSQTLVTFTGVEDLRGAGEEPDQFNFSNANLGGFSVFAGNDDDVIDTADFSAVVGGFEVVLSQLAGFELLRGNATSQGTIKSGDTRNAWTISSDNAGTIRVDGDNDGDFESDIRFERFSRLRGGSGQDTFTLQNNGTIVAVDGEGGNNSFVNQKEGDFLWNIPSTGQVGSVEQIISTGNQKINDFSNIQNITAGSGVDIFVVANGSDINNVQAGGGNSQDIADFSSVSGPLNFDFAQDTYAGISQIEILVGNGAESSLIGAVGENNSWQLGVVEVSAYNSEGYNDGLNDGLVSTATKSLVFSNIENLVGRNDTVDEFVIKADGRFTGRIDGGELTGAENSIALETNQNTIWRLNGTNSGEAEVGVDTFTFSNISQLDAGAGDDLLVASGTSDNQWQITNQNEGTLNTVLKFKQFESLTGAATSDSFLFGVNGSLVNTDGSAGQIDGSEGSDRLAMSSAERRIWDLEVGQINREGAAQQLAPELNFSNIEVVQGGAGVDEFSYSSAVSENIELIAGGLGSDVLTAISAGSAANTWNITGNNTGELILGGESALIFEAIENLVGGASFDRFVFASSTATSESLDGGLGGNEIVTSDGNNVWTIIGENSGTFENSSATKFNAVARLIGGAGDDFFTILAGGKVQQIIGGAGENTLANTDTGNFIWQIPDAGMQGNVSRNVSGNPEPYLESFTDIQTYEAGVGDDIFIFSPDHNTTAVKAGDGTDIVDFSLQTSNIDITLNNTSIGLVENVEVVIGNGENTTIRGGEGTANIWRIGVDEALPDYQSTGYNDGINDGKITDGNNNSWAFINVGRLVGGATVDDGFTITQSGRFTGEIDGGSAGNGTTDALQIDQSFNSDWLLSSNNAGSVSGENSIQFSNITDIIAGSANDTLTAPNGDNRWQIDAQNAGTINGALSFTGFEKLGSGSGDDVFLFTATGHLIHSDGSAGVIDAGSGEDILELQSTTNQVWTINGDAQGVVQRESSALEFTSFERLVGGAGEDQFNYGPEALVINGIDGRGGNDTLVADNINDEFGISLANLWAISAVNGGTLVQGVKALQFAGIENIVGGAEADAVVLTANSALAGIIDTGLGQDSILAADGANTWVLQNGISTVENVSGARQQFTGIEQIEGNNDIDQVQIINASEANEIRLFGGDDFVELASEALNIMTLDAGTGNDVLLASANFSDWQINASAGHSVDGQTFTGFTSLLMGPGDSTISLIELGEITNLDAGAGDDTFKLLLPELSISLLGGEGNDSLEAQLLENDWRVTGDARGTLINEAGEVEFISVENLVGNELADYFVFSETGRVAAIAGGNSAFSDGDDYYAIVDEIRLPDSLAVNVQIEGAYRGKFSFANEPENITNFTGIETIYGSDSSDQFIVADGGVIYEIFAGAGDDLLDFGDSSQFTNAYGSLGDDTFIIGRGVIVANNGVADGGTGGEVEGDLIDMSALGIPVFTLVDPNDDFEIPGPFSNENFERSIAPINVINTIVGADFNSIWTVTDEEMLVVVPDPDNPGINLFEKRISLKENGEYINLRLLGGDARDQFVFASADARVTEGFDGGETVEGKDGLNTIIGFATDTRWRIDSEAGGTFYHIVDGNEAMVSDFGRIDRIEGGSANDEFILSSGGAIDKLIGGAGIDSLRAADENNLWSIQATNGKLASGFSNNLIADFESIERIFGGLGNDEFVLLGALQFNLIDAGIDDAGRNVLNLENIHASVVVTPGEEKIEFLGSSAQLRGIDHYQAQFNADRANTIVAPDAVNTWRLVGNTEGELSQASTDEGLAITFAGFNVLEGGENTDNFFANGFIFNGTVRGNGGNDNFDLSGDEATFGVVEGGAGEDRIIGPDGDTTWTLSGADVGSLLSAGLLTDFSMVENIVTGTGSDDIVLASATASLSGILDASQGTSADSLTAFAEQATIWRLNDSLDLILENSADEIILVNAKNIESLKGSDQADIFELSRIVANTSIDIDGGASIDTISIAEGANVWSLNDSGGELAGIAEPAPFVTFTNIGLLVGGSGEDQFIVNNNSQVIGFNGGINDLSVNQLNLVGMNANAEVNLRSQEIISVEQGQGTNIWTFSNIGSFLGNADRIDTLVAQDAENAWVFSNANSGSISNTLSGSVEFSGFNNFVGGILADTFDLAGNALSGSIDARAGDDSLILSTAGSSVATFIGWEGSDSIIGSDVNSEWTLSGENSGRINTTQFVSTENLIAGAGNDRFIVTAEGSISGNIDGGSGNNTLAKQDGTNTWQLAVSSDGTTTLYGGTVNGVANFTNINVLEGGAEEDTLVARDLANVWSLSTANGGTLTDSVNNSVQFNNFETLVGGSDTDEFIVVGKTFDAFIDGAGGSDSIDLMAIGKKLNLGLERGLALATEDRVAINISNIEAVDANPATAIDNIVYGKSDQAYAWIVSGENQINVQTEQGSEAVQLNHFGGIIGGSNADRFRVDGEGKLDFVNGGQGLDSIDFSQTERDLDISIADAIGSDLGFTLFSIEGIVGNNSGENSDSGSPVYNATIRGVSEASEWTITGLNDGEVKQVGSDDIFVFTDFNRIIAGSADDTITIEAGAYVAGTIDTGAGNDIVNISVLPNDILTEQRIIGGDGSDTVEFSSSLAGLDGAYSIDGSDEIFNFSDADSSYVTRLNSFESINDLVNVFNFSINSQNAGDIVDITNDSFQIANAAGFSGSVINRGDSQNLRVVAPGNTIAINDNLEQSGTIELVGGTIDLAENNSLNANQLILDNIAGATSAASAVNTNVNELLIKNGSQAIFVQEEQDLTLLELDSQQLININVLSGDIIDSSVAGEILVGANPLTLNAADGNIVLDATTVAAHQLSGPLSLSASGTIELNNQASVNLAAVNAGNLSVTSGADIIGSGALQVDENALFNANGAVTLNNQSNDFSNVEIAGATDVSIYEIDSVTVTFAESANNLGDIDLSAATLNIDGSVSAVNILAQSRDQQLVTNSNLTGSQLVSLLGQGVEVSGNVSSAEIVVNSGAGDLLVNSVLNGSEKVELISGAMIQSGTGSALISGGLLVASAQTGIGTADSPLKTSVSQLELVNNTGLINVQNSGEVIVDAIYTVGDITLTNNGNVLLNNGAINTLINSPGETPINVTDIPLSAEGMVTLNINNGSLLSGESILSIGDPQIVTTDLDINVSNGNFGANGQAFVFYARDSVSITSDASLSTVLCGFEICPRFGFDDTSAIKARFGTTASELIVEVETLNEINPGVFTGLKSYFYNETSIYLPRDQRYEDDEEEELWASEESTKN